MRGRKGAGPGSSRDCARVEVRVVALSGPPWGRTRSRRGRDAGPLARIAYAIPRRLNMQQNRRRSGSDDSEFCRVANSPQPSCEPARVSFAVIAASTPRGPWTGTPLIAQTPNQPSSVLRRKPCKPGHSLIECAPRPGLPARELQPFADPSITGGAAWVARRCRVAERGSSPTKRAPFASSADAGRRREGNPR